MRVVVLANTHLDSLHGQHRDALAKIGDALARWSVNATIERVPAGELLAQSTAAARSGADAVVAAGGDGTISAVAAGLVDTRVPLGVIPLGTFNHFARDIGVVPDLQQAVRTIVAGSVRQIDVGEVNARFFVNNASIGAYPAMAIDRARQMKFGRSKWRAMLRSTWRVLQKFPLMEVRLALEAGNPWCRTPCIFIGNNRYRFDLLAPGTRSALDQGRLSVHVTRATTRLAVLRLGLKAVLGRIAHDDDLITAELPEFWIECRRRRVAVGLDGEVHHLETPLHFRVRPLALSVLVPNG